MKKNNEEKQQQEGSTAGPVSRSIDKRMAMSKEEKLKEAQKKIGEISKSMNLIFPERKSLIQGALTALLAKEHVLVLGPPGTAKSMFARVFADAVAGGSYFELLLTKFTTVEEVFGPISFIQLKNDKYVRLLNGYAADARIVVLDEIFKGSSSINNCNLTLINERAFHNGGKLIPAPLELMMAMSNEYPQDPSLDALFDRFAFKYWVDYISDRDSLEYLLSGKNLSKPVEKMDDDDISALREATCTMPFGTSCINTLLNIKSALQDKGFFASDRTWVKAVKIVKARAILNGRTTVSSSDFMVLSDVMWLKHSDRDAMNTVIGNAADPYGSRAEAIIDGVKTAMNALPDICFLKSGQKTKVEFMHIITEISGQVASRKDALDDLVSEADQDNDSIDQAKEICTEAREQIDKFMSEVTYYREMK